MSDTKKTKTFKDPNAAAEAEKYDNPVASRDALLMVLEEAPSPLTHPEVCEVLGETDEDRVEAVRRRLIAMCRDGQLISNRRNQFMPMKKVDLVQGTVMGHRDGFGFVLRDEGDDVYLSNRQMRKVFHGDKVAVQFWGWIVVVARKVRSLRFYSATRSRSLGVTSKSRAWAFCNPTTNAFRWKF